MRVGFRILMEEEEDEDSLRAVHPVDVVTIFSTLLVAVFVLLGGELAEILRAKNKEKVLPFFWFESASGRI